MIAFGKGVKIHLGDGITADVSPPAGGNAAVQNTEIRIRHNEGGVNEHLHPKTRAFGTGAVGIVEGKEPRRQFLDGDAAVLTGVVLGKGDLPVFPDQVNQHQAACKGQRRFGRIAQTAGDLRLYYKAVYDDLDIMLFVLFQLDLFGQIVHIPVHPGADIAGLLGILQHLDMLAFLPADHRGQDLDPGAFRQGHDLVHDLVDGLLADLSAALGTVGHADARPEKAEIIVYLRHGPHGGTGILGGGLLVDGDGGRKPVDIVHVRLVHLPQEHAGVGAEALHIAPLAFGIDRIEGKAGFSAAGKARDHHQLVPRNAEIDIFEVILPCALNENLILHNEFPCDCSFQEK